MRHLFFRARIVRLRVTAYWFDIGFNEVRTTEAVLLIRSVLLVVRAHLLPECCQHTWESSSSTRFMHCGDLSGDEIRRNVRSIAVCRSTEDDFIESASSMIIATGDETTTLVRSLANRSKRRRAESEKSAERFMRNGKLRRISAAR